MRASIVAVALVALAITRGRASADAPGAADAAGDAFREASRLAIEGDPRGLAALEALGSARPTTRWTDDAWSELARHAERTGDLARARRAHARVIEVGTDAALVARSRAALVRLGSRLEEPPDIAVRAPDGLVRSPDELVREADPRWDRVTVEHRRLVTAANAGGDPGDALRALESLVRANATYPRATQLRAAIALGWEREGDIDRALSWYRIARDEASTEVDRFRAHVALVRAAIRADALALASAELVALERAGLSEPPTSSPMRDDVVVRELRASLDAADDRRTRGRVLGGLLVAMLLGAIAIVRRDSGSWRGVGRAFARVPVEVLYFAPVAALLVGVARTGNPRVGNAVTAIAIVGVLVAYVSGVSLEAARGVTRPTWRRIVGSSCAALVAVGLAAYLAVDHYRVIDMLRETVAHGFAR